MKRLLTALLVSILLVISVSGCQEENSQNSDRRAKLIANENLRLELNEKNAEITSLQSQLDECKKENKGLQDQAVKTGDGFMEILKSINEDILKLSKENASLKEKIKELEK